MYLGGLGPKDLHVEVRPQRLHLFTTHMPVHRVTDQPHMKNQPHCRLPRTHRVRRDLGDALAVLQLRARRGEEVAEVQQLVVKPQQRGQPRVGRLVRRLLGARGLALL